MQLKESLWHMQRSEGPHLRLPVKLEHGVLLCWALNTETRVVTPKRRAGKESEGRVCLQSENILFLLPTHQDKSGLAQLTGCHTAEPSPARSAGGGPVRWGPPAAVCGRNTKLQKLWFEQSVSRSARLLGKCDISSELGRIRTTTPQIKLVWESIFSWNKQF